MTIEPSQPSAQSEDVVYQFEAGASGWYAACASGLYRSIDGGASWKLAYASLGAEEALATLCVASVIGPEQSAYVFAGLSGELLRSADGGETWEVASRPAPAPVFTALIPSPNFASDGMLFAGTLEDGILIYSSYGREWAQWNFGLLDTTILCLTVSPDYANDQTLFVGVPSGIFGSTNGGRSWREIDTPFGYEALLSLALSPCFATDGTLYAGSESQGLWRSTDRGNTWQRVDGGSLNDPVNSIQLDPHFPSQPKLLILHGAQPLISSDGGSSWNVWYNDDLTGQDVTALLAPQGFEQHAPALVGVADGAIRVYA